MPKFQSTIFRTGDGRLAKFLVDNFGLTQNGRYIEQTRERSSGTAIEIDENPSFTKHKDNPAFWKVGLLMPDVKQQTAKLRDAKVKVGYPEQFMDIGYLVHTSDPDGNTLELLQHTFEDNFKGPFAENPVTVGQVTIRTSKLDETLAFYGKTLGMRTLSVQPVTAFGFTLYFLGYTSDTPPNAQNLEAIENREWLWKKPYCTIEIQHGEGRQAEQYVDLKDDEKGWAGIRITATAAEAKSLMGIAESKVLRDPNNIPVYVDVQK